MAKKKSKPRIEKGKLSTCIVEARKTLSLLEPEELNDYLTNVFAKAARYEDVAGDVALERAMGEVNNEILQSMTEDLAIKARNTEVYERNVDKIKQGFNVRNFIIKTSRNQDYNLQNSQQVETNLLVKEVMGNLSRDELKLWQTGKLDDEIAAVANGKKSTNELAKKIGEIIRRYPTEIRNPRMVESTALSLSQIRDDRFLTVRHNATKIANAGQSLVKRTLSRDKIKPDTAKQTWITDIRETLDEEATARNINALDMNGEVDQAKLSKFLERAYDNIIGDRSAIFTRSTIANDADALQRKQRMYIVFKDWEAFNRYNKKYGQGTLFNATMSDIKSSGRRIGLARIFGDSPHTMLKELQKAQIDIRPQGKLKQMEAESLFIQQTGATGAAWSPKLASFGGAIRAYSGMTRLGMIVFNSLNDLTMVGSTMQRFGYGFWKPYVDQMLTQFGFLSKENRQTIAKQMHLNLRAHMGYMGNWADASNVGDIMSKLSSRFYHLNMMEGWGNGLKLSAMTSLAESLGKDSGKSFENLHEQTKYQLDKHGISSSEWDALRSRTTRGLFSLDNVDAMSNAEISSLWDSSDKSVSRSEYKSHLMRKVYGLFDTVSETASLDPGAYEKMITTGNFAPGTIRGELWRSFGQFKSYPISYFRKGWIGGMSEMQGAQAKVMYAVNMMASNFALGYLSVVLSNLMLGKTTPDIKDMPLTDLALMVAPGLGAFVKVLSSKNQEPNMLLDMLFSPSVRLMSDPFVAAVAAATGNEKGAKRIAKDFFNYANPIGTVPVVSPFVRQLMGDKPYLDPGQQQLYGA